MQDPDYTVEREDYATRKEYRWAHKNAKRARAKESAAWRYPAAALAVVVYVFSHDVLAAFIVLVVAGIAFRYFVRRERAANQAELDAESEKSRETWNDMHAELGEKIAPPLTKAMQNIAEGAGNEQ